VRITVSDTGARGDNLEKIFEPFVSSKDQGLGLGLAICRSIVSAHDGRLWAENNSEDGATFHLVLASRRRHADARRHGATPTVAAVTITGTSVRFARTFEKSVRQTCQT
jgi:two-component system sensor kinase FixL